MSTEPRAPPLRVPRRRAAMEPERSRQNTVPGIARLESQGGNTERVRASLEAAYKGQGRFSPRYLHVAMYCGKSP